MEERTWIVANYYQSFSSGRKTADPSITNVMQAFSDKFKKVSLTKLSIRRMVKKYEEQKYRPQSPIPCTMTLNIGGISSMQCPKVFFNI